jgi:integrase/recombinase XerD
MRGIYQVFDTLKHLTGIKEVRCSPHTMRHTRATDLLRAGISPRFLQTMLGHKDPRMVQRYSETIDSEDALRAIREVDNKCH